MTEWEGAGAYTRDTSTFRLHGVTLTQKYIP